MRFARAARRADTVLGAVSKAGALVASAAILGILFAVVAEVAHREVRGSSIGGVLEASEMALVFAAWLGAGYAQRNGAVIATGVVVERLPPRVATVCQAIALVATAGFVAWVGWEALNRALDAIETHEVRMGLVEIAVWPGRVALAVGLALVLLETLRALIILVAADDWSDRASDSGLTL